MKWFGSLFLFFLLTPVFASTEQPNPAITIRAYYVGSGKPVPNYEFLVYRMNPATGTPVERRDDPIRIITDANGKASFSSALLPAIPETVDDESVRDSTANHRRAITKQLDLLLLNLGAGAECTRSLFSLQEVLASGIVGDNHCNNKPVPASFESSPGEVIVFLKKDPWWKDVRD